MLSWLNSSRVSNRARWWFWKVSDITGASAEVVSALPLTVDEQEVVKKDILSKMGDTDRD